MLRRIAGGVALAAFLLTSATPAMAADWRYVMSSGSRDVVQAECNNGVRFGAWNECDIRQDRGYHLWVR